MLCGRLNKTNEATAGNSKTVTIIGCINGLGKLIFVYPGQHMLPGLMGSAIPVAQGTESKIAE